MKPKAAATFELVCAAKRGATAHFTGHLVSAEKSIVSMIIVGGAEGFEQLKTYTVVFLPAEDVKNASAP